MEGLYGVKMKIKLLTLIGYLSGGLIFLGSYLKWINLSKDLSSAFFGMAIGIIILCGAYVYQRLNDINLELKELDKGLDLQNIWIRDELEKFDKLNSNSLSEKKDN